MDGLICTARNPVDVSGNVLSIVGRWGLELCKAFQKCEKEAANNFSASRVLLHER